MIDADERHKIDRMKNAVTGKFSIKEREKKDCGYLLTPSDKLRDLLLKNPGMPILAFAMDDAYGSDYGMTSCDLRVEKGEFLNCQQEINKEKIYTDRDDFNEDVADIIYDNAVDILGQEGYDSLPDEVKDALWREAAAQYDPYWTGCILVIAEN